MSRIDLVASSKLRRILNEIHSPVVEEIPFFILFFLLISLSCFKYLIAGIINSNINSIVYINLARAVAISYTLSAIIYFSKSRLFKILFYSLAVALFALNVFLWLIFHLIIGPEIITYIGETNPREASEFISTYLLSGRGILVILIVLIAIGLIFFAEHYRCRIAQWIKSCGSRPLCYIVPIALIAIIVFGLFHFDIYYKIAKSKETEDLPIHDPFPYDAVTSSLFSLSSIRTTNHEMNKAIKVTSKIVKGYIVSKDSLNIILVIGESYIKYHSSLYGYQLQTCPNLERELKHGNLYIFSNVVSPYNGTSSTLKNLFSCNSIDKDEKWYNYPVFPAIFKKSGFKVYYWDNQRTDQTQGLWVYSLNSFLFNKDIAANAYTELAKVQAFGYDDQLIKDFGADHKKESVLNLIIFHLWGQHLNAAARYPHTKQFEKFSYKDEKKSATYLTDSKRQDIANYDNATYYNDFVLKHIIDLYRNKNTVLLYLSDHGEEMYDYRDSKGRVGPWDNELANYLKYQYGIPFMIWCSDVYKKKHPEIIKEIEVSQNKTFMSDNTCNVLFHLAGLKTKYYRPDCDLLSPFYKIHDRILGSGVNYDKETLN